MRFLAIIIAIFCFYLPAHAKVDKYLTFENYGLNLKNFSPAEGSTQWSPSVSGTKNYYKIVDNPVRSGGKALEMYNQRVSDTDSGFRTEITVLNETGANELVIGNEYWIGFSIYLPPDFVCDGCTKPNYNYEIHGQIHAIPDRGPRQRSGQPEETDISPPMFIEIRENNWYFHVLSDADPISTNNNVDKSKLYNIGSWSGDLGTWTDWVLHFKLDYTENGTNGGFVEVYKNGSIVVNDKGGNCYNDLRGPYFTFGTYKFSWKSNATDTDIRRIYYDEIKIGDMNSSFGEVSPGAIIEPKAYEHEVEITPAPPKNLKIVP